MIPSVWKNINTTTNKNINPTVFALTEAFMQIKNKYEREMKASKISIKPVVIRSLFNASDSSIISNEDYSNIKIAAEIVFNKCEIISYTSLPDENNLNNINYDFSNKYKMDLYFSDAKQTNIEMIDINPHIWALLRFIIRDEIKVFVRITGDDDLPLFIDEFEVSPTIVIDPLITPFGGFLETVEKNNSMPIHIDWGSEGDSNEHVLRVNTSYYAPSDIPPLDVFKSDLVKNLEKEENDKNACKQLIYAIKTEDMSLFEVILDTYPESNFNFVDSEGKSPIHYAVSVGSFDMTKALLDKKVNPNILTYENNTALHEALSIEKPSIEICNLLIKYGADINLKNIKGQTPLDLAKIKNISIFQQNE